MSSPHTTSGITRTVLVTGAARRLGREIALALARAGWQMAIHCRNSHEDAEATARDCTAISGHPCKVFVADLSVESEARQLVPQVIEHFGSVQAVVNNACLFEHDTHETFSFDSMESHMRSNTGAAILLASALHAHLQQSNAPTKPYGVVINLLDQKLWNPNPDFLSYTLSKAALEAANTLLAQALAPNVRVVGIAPGLTLTSHLLSEDAFAKMHKLSPLGRSSTPEDVAATVVFACSNSSITGTTLLVDGGQHLHRFDRDFSMMELNGC